MGSSPVSLYFSDKHQSIISDSHGNLGRWQSGQMHQTVNLAAEAFGGSNPSLPTKLESDRKGRTTEYSENNAVVAQLVEHQPSKLRVAGSIPVRRSDLSVCRPWASSFVIAYVAQSVEHVLGKDEVTGSIPVVGSTLICQSI